MKKVNNEKETIMKLYRDNISEIIWTHKIQATILDDLKKKNKIYKICKELLIGLSSFVSVLFLYYEKYTGALISCAVSTISIIFDNVINFSDFDNRIRITNENVKRKQSYNEVLYTDSGSSKRIIGKEIKRVNARLRMLDDLEQQNRLKTQKLIEEITNRNIKTKQASRIRLVKSNY